MVALSNCMVIGDRRKFLAMVVTLKTEMDTETGGCTDRLAADSLFVGKQVRALRTYLHLLLHSSRSLVTDAAECTCPNLLAASHCPLQRHALFRRHGIHLFSFLFFCR